MPCPPGITLQIATGLALQLETLSGPEQGENLQHLCMHNIYREGLSPEGVADFKKKANTAQFVFPVYECVTVTPMERLKVSSNFTFSVFS